MTVEPSKNPLVARLRLLTGLSDTELKAVEDACSNVSRLPADTNVIREGDPADRVHVLLDGWAYRYRDLADGRRQIVALLLPGDVCDLDALYARRLPYGVSTVTRCRVAALTHPTLLELTSAQVGISRALTWLAIAENMVLTEWNVCLGRRSAREHLAHLLCELLVRLSIVGRAEPNGYDIPLSQEKLAEVLGLTSVHVNRTLQGLRASQLIKLESQRLTILDWPALKAAADFRSAYLQAGSSHAISG